MLEIFSGWYRALPQGLARFALFAMAAAVCATSPGSLAWAQGAGDLTVAPTRVVFEGHTRSARLSLANKGSVSATYRITVVNMRMEDDGTMREITSPDPGQRFADKLFRYSPRQITLAPGAVQAVRVMLRKPKDLAAGEYRSHIMFRAVPQDAGRSVEQTTVAEGIQIKLTPIYGITIPVIVRHGNSTHAVALRDLELLPRDAANPTPRVRFEISREGESSAFGDLTATYKAPSGDETVIGELMRLAVYAPNKARTVEMHLRVPDGLSLTGGSLHLAYRETPEAGGAVMAETTLRMP